MNDQQKQWFNDYKVVTNRKILESLIERSEVHNLAYAAGNLDSVHEDYNTIMISKSGSVRDAYHYGQFGKAVFSKELI